VTFTVDERERLDKFLARMLPEHSRTKLVKMIAGGEVRVEGAVAEKASMPLEPGMRVELPAPEDAPAHDLTPADIPLDVRYEDDLLLVVNKPRGLAVHPAPSLKEPSLVNALLARGGTLSETAGAFRPGIVHRLDKETTGLLVVAKTDAAHVALARQIEGRSAERRYLAVVAREVEPERFRIDSPIGRDPANRQRMAVHPRGKRAVTHVKKLARHEQGTLVAARLETGRTHQIRVHLAAVGHPVLGDTTYAPKEWGEGPMQLHAAFLSFEHPTSGERLAIYAPPDEQFLGRELVERQSVDPF
jgi:23S rRNA pseudouridine1911/1915/1917 synthase